MIAILFQSQYASFLFEVLKPTDLFARPKRRLGGQDHTVFLRLVNSFILFHTVEGNVGGFLFHSKFLAGLLQNLSLRSD